MKSASEKIPFVPGRMTSVMCASGKTRRSARNAGIVISESPTQFVPRTTTRLILSTISNNNFLQDHADAVIDPDLRTPVQLFLDSFCIRNITQRHGRRHRRIVLNHRLDVDDRADFFQQLAKANRIQSSAAEVVKSVLNRRVYKRATRAREVVDVQNIADRIDVRRQSN